MLRYILASSSFIVYLVLLSVTRTRDKSVKLLKKSFFAGFCLWGVALSLTFVVNILVNSVFFGDPFSPLEGRLEWIPVLRAPIVEEGSKFFSLLILKKKLKISGNEIIRIGGSLGNWFSYVENINYILSKSITLWATLFRLFPTHICYTFLGAIGLKNNKKLTIFPVLAVILHGFQNFLSINYFIIYVFSGFAVFLGMFFIVLVRTPIE